MRIKAIVCEVLAREAYLCAATSPHIVDMQLVEKGLHNVPANLQDELQKMISAVQPERYDAIVLAYGLCGNALAGIAAGQVPVVLPRAHDCITLYLGSREAYRVQFTERPGTYYYTPDYIERRGADSSFALGAADEGKSKDTYAEYVAKYGKENADYLMEVMGAWKAHYRHATYISIPDAGLPDYRQGVQEEAARRGWEYHEVDGQMDLVRDLLHGNWDEARFLRVAPGQQIVATYGDEIVRAGWCAACQGAKDLGG
ncbi:MAG: DUF1638 domain-containing protein [Chloroflexi bacterium]|nr:DUF1638 domain-containing protein [Chloroflexota bacterium]